MKKDSTIFRLSDRARALRLKESNLEARIAALQETLTNVRAKRVQVESKISEVEDRAIRQADIARRKAWTAS